MEGVPCVASVDDLPGPVDLAVIAVPPSAVPEVAEQCGRHGVRALIVISSGRGAAGADLLAICRRYGMRLVGPNCFGVIMPWIGLDATFAANHPVRGVAGADGAVRRGGDRAAGADVQAGYRRVLLRVGRRQVRRVP